MIAGFVSLDDRPGPELGPDLLDVAGGHFLEALDLEFVENAQHPVQSRLSVLQGAQLSLPCPSSYRPANSRFPVPDFLASSQSFRVRSFARAIAKLCSTVSGDRRTRLPATQISN
jgi:hypothetical protein